MLSVSEAGVIKPQHTRIYMYTYVSEETFQAIVNRKGHPVTTAGSQQGPKQGREVHVTQESVDSTVRGSR